MGWVRYLVLTIFRRSFLANYNKRDDILNGNKTLSQRHLIQNKARIRRVIDSHDKLEEICLTYLKLCRLTKKVL